MAVARCQCGLAEKPHAHTALTTRAVVTVGLKRALMTTTTHCELRSFLVAHK